MTRGWGRSPSSFVDLYWLPLGAGDSAIVRWNGRLYEALTARVERRAPCDLYHAALEVGLDGVRYTIEMGPAWGLRRARPRCRGRGSGGVAVAGALATPATRCGDGVTARSPTSRKPSEALGG